MSNLRTWATPVTIASFLIMAVTGALMFFHLDSGLNKLVHEWAGWVMVAGVAAHLLLNWRAFTVYFRRPMGRGLIAIGAVVLALSFWPAAGGTSPMQAVMQAIGRADVGTVIALSGQDMQTGLDRLAAAGYAAQSDTPVSALTGGDRGQQMQIVNALFAD